jgi:hypothetical protein
MLSIGRLLRYLASVRIIKGTGANTFTKNNLTETFSNAGIYGGIYHK